MKSDKEVNINNNLEYVEISCNLVDKNKNFVDGKRSDILIQIPITTKQLLKGSVSQIEKTEEGISFSNGVYNELEFKVKGNYSSVIGNVLLEFTIK